MDLFEVSGGTPHRPTGGHRGRHTTGIGLTCGKVGEQAFREIPSPVRIEASRYRHHRVRGAVVALMEPREPLAGCPNYIRQATRDRRPCCVAWPEDLDKVIGSELLRRILVALDLLDDDLPLGLHGLRSKSGMGHHVGEKVHCHVEVGVGDPYAVPNHLPVGAGIQIAAHTVHFQRDALRRASLRAFENHMFEEVGKSGFTRPLVP